jgi:uncharacterized protein (DUF488 family)
VSVFTIGFTKKTAEEFFSLLKSSSVERLIDVRLNNVSQLAGFAKKKDLQYFLQQLCGIDYVHSPNLAPTDDILKAYKKNEITWDEYERRFLDLMDLRSIDQEFDLVTLEQSCLLCSEHQPHHCHRRLVVEYLNDRWDSKLEVKHLV